MEPLIFTIYVAVATYYFLGILRTWTRIVRKDAVLRLFVKDCPSAKWFSALLMLLFAYCWPIGLATRPLIRNLVIPRLLVTKVKYETRIFPDRR